ncbi:hypothetical protein ACRAR1_07010 [Streptomyces sanyensis]|uniref:hypothetical protein n=1 Tax=Streptomyces sanyensis TaxID=568869 RepID=UPI003D77FF63
MTTVQPYDPTTRWRFRTRMGGYEHVVPLVYHWEVNGAPMSDDYTPDEADAAELWARWIAEFGNRGHLDYPERLKPGQVTIYWSVLSPGGGGIFESAPYGPPMLWSDSLREDFLTHYSEPVHEKTEEPINWTRVPVRDLGWSSTASDKGGFIQEATGWKPSPLQAVMDVGRIAAASGLPGPAPLNGA